MERIKDFFFDLSDIVISLVIIAVIFIVVTWKLSDTMPLNLSLFNKNQTEAELAVKNTETGKPVELDMTGNSGTPTDQTGDTQSDPNATSPEPEPEPEPDPEPVTTVMIEIPAGASGDSIARILRDHDLIDDVNNFIKVVSDHGWGNKLRAGKFTLKSDMTDEDIARKLTGN
ncbi:MULTISPECIES: hypothetical protein [unclassified Fusibacter]|uniref:hypothetical protein n=1 Tax=unclassified Fusibacter TaxID=2624464 RepID=UPI001013A0BD|nr:MULTISPECIES: hypothetical protein [unclassified Fusibacter]MCK8061403.1 endolytic transglycosylase MltG [Fusibacter sp. A2]NPE23554.1 hypothetical protein [Fusibacter sp. A1]RXV58964.1 hypothetical protein DWB64_17350 [Fusibacter sp. A1]